MENVIRDRKTNTLWHRSTSSDGIHSYECEICHGTRYCCCGCGGMSCMYPDLFDCCSKRVCCPNCTLLMPLIEHRGHEHESSIVADMEFKVKKTRYSRLLEEATICYSPDDDFSNIPEERLKYLPRINGNFLLFHTVASVSNEEEDEEEEEEDDEEEEDELEEMEDEKD
mmetsp:Transcript_7764/g.10712  ORF Transcript_7764/g.10712 Transcript_7764/m.10712 type:complete len:169 (+) Transcript_7764:34-540(+)